MKPKFLYLIFIAVFLTGGIAASTNGDLPSFSVSALPEPTPTTPVKTEIEEVKISGETIATIAGGDFVYPTFSPDGRKLAYSKVLVEDGMENSEVHLYDLQSRNKFVLLNAKQSKKYAVYASFVSNLEWVGANRLNAFLSDGDVDSTTLTFNTQTRRVIKKQFSSYDEDALSEPVSPDMKPAFLALQKSFPDFPKGHFISAFNMLQARKIGSRGVVLQFNHADEDSNVWYFDFATKKKYLLAEAPKENEMLFRLTGATEVAGSVLFFTEYKGETTFSVYKNAKVVEILKTKFGGGFQPLFSTAKKSVFLLKEPNYQSEMQSSLWIFDGNELKRATDVEKLVDVNIDSTGKTAAFCYQATKTQRHISVRKLKADF
jgi:hypothetical protein